MDILVPVEVSETSMIQPNLARKNASTERNHKKIAHNYADYFMWTLTNTHAKYCTIRHAKVVKMLPFAVERNSTEWSLMYGIVLKSERWQYIGPFRWLCSSYFSR